MKGAPKTNTDELIDRINTMGRYVSEKNELNVFAWRGLLKDLEKLETVPERAEFSLLHQVVMWGMKPDREKMKSLLNRCAARFGKTQDWHLIRSNYATLFGDATMVTDLLSSGSAQGGATHMGKVVDVLVSSGFFITARKMLVEMHDRDRASVTELSRRYPFVNLAAAYLLQHGLDELDVAMRILTSTKVVADAGHRLRKFTVSAGPYGVSVELVVDAPIEQLVDMNFAISDAISESFEHLISEHLTTGVTPWRAAR